MFTLKFTTGIRPTEKNVALARAAQIYYHKGVYAEKPVEAAEQKPKVESKAEQKKPVAEKKPEDKKSIEQKPAEKPEQKKPEDKKSESKVEQKPVDQKKPEDKKPVAEQKPVAADKKQEDQKKPEDKKPVEQKADQKKPEQKPADKPVVEVLDRKGNVVAMLPGVPEEAPKAARTTGTGFDINNFVKPPKQQQDTKNLGQVKNVDEVYKFIRTNAVLRPFDPMPGYSIGEKVTVLKTYANFNGTHPGLDEIQINTLLMVFNSPDLSRKMINCGLDPKQVLGVRKFNEVPVNKYDSNDVYDFAFEYTFAKKKKLVLLLNSIPTYDSKNGWMSAYNISVR